ncbi:aromatic acid decarboxylase [Achromatium sp. WMS2]|nr:aromatic acid decarboxylase [Achromatium sp. WMS2]
MSNNQALTVAITGASGARYGLRLLECLVQANIPIYLLISPSGRAVLRTEFDLKIPKHPQKISQILTQYLQAPPGQIAVFGSKQWTAPVASGSNPPRAMIVCPCTTGTLAGIATGLSTNLIERAASVMLKERRQLILVIRETPLSPLHLENMLRLANIGVLIMPASPGFYFKPQCIEDLIDFIVARILDQLSIPHTLTPRWGD